MSELYMTQKANRLEVDMENYPKFTILAEKLRGRTFEISKAEMSIGSHEDNDICIND